MYQQYFYPVFASDFINDSVISFYQFSDLFVILFRHYSSCFWHRLQHIRFVEKLRHDGRSIIF